MSTATVETEKNEKTLMQDPMMAHLMRSLNEGRNIGHYGRLVFAMVAHWFLGKDAVVEWLQRDKNFTDEDAVALWKQVEEHGYNPPNRDTIAEWQTYQSFPILPEPKNPECGNVYKSLQFPDEVYESIQEYYKE
ncbi:MAG: hypothetical protein R3338_10430 [Thermoanaerobaculia bacterium]|nr:hypothetical protein [Thermoanaerobaculia bacterium]